MIAVNDYAGDQGFITIKGPTEGISRLGYKYEIPRSDAQEMLDRFKPEGTEKIRYCIPGEKGLVWEVDEFLGGNKGLIIAELELLSEDQAFFCTDWMDVEVTDDDRYANSKTFLCIQILAGKPVFA